MVERGRTLTSIASILLSSSVNHLMVVSQIMRGAVYSVASMICRAVFRLPAHTLTFNNRSNLSTESFCSLLETAYVFERIVARCHDERQNCLWFC